MKFNIVQKHERGFIGPIGDDLPSLIMIVLALTLFFSGVVFCLNAYNQKIDNMHILTGAMDISRVLTRTSLVPDPIPTSNAEDIAISYGLKYDTYFEGGVPSDCPVDDYAYVFKFLVAKGSGGSATELDTLIIRVCE